MTQEEAMHKKIRQYLRRVVGLMLTLRANPLTLPLTDGYAVKVCLIEPEDTREPEAVQEAVGEPEAVQEAVGEPVPELEPETVEE